MGYNGTKSKLHVGQVVELPDGKAEVIAYNGVMSVTLKFLETGYETSTQSGHILRGNVRDRLKPIFYGRGFMGEGPHKGSSKSKAYTTWMGMFNRCYGGVNIPYLGCEVDPQWYNFQEFAEWCSWQLGYDEWSWPLEKDIIVKNNRVYGPEFCAFVPREINSSVVNTKNVRGWTETKGGGKFMAHCGGKYLGTFPTKDIAYQEYITEKKAQMSALCEKWRGLVDNRLLYRLDNYY